MLTSKTKVRQNKFYKDFFTRFAILTHRSTSYTFLTQRVNRVAKRTANNFFSRMCIGKKHTHNFFCGFKIYHAILLHTPRRNRSLCVPLRYHTLISSAHNTYRDYTFDLVSLPPHDNDTPNFAKLNMWMVLFRGDGAVSSPNGRSFDAHCLRHFVAGRQ